MAVVGREALEQRAVETMTIEVKAWGGEILIRKLNSIEVPKLIAMASSAMDPATGKMKDPERMSRWMATALYWSWVDESGAQVLTDARADIDRLAQEPFDLLDAISDAINEWNGITKKAQAAVDEAKKNLEPTESEDFGTF